MLSGRWYSTGLTPSRTDWTRASPSPGSLRGWVPTGRAASPPPFLRVPARIRSAVPLQAPLVGSGPLSPLPLGRRRGRGSLARDWPRRTLSRPLGRGERTAEDSQALLRRGDNGGDLGERRIADRRGLAWAAIAAAADAERSALDAEGEARTGCPRAGVSLGSQPRSARRETHLWLAPT